jgi:hypothetical protein
MTDEPVYPFFLVNKDDLRHLFRDPETGKVPERIERYIDALSEDDMNYLASKCPYWEAIKAIFLDDSSEADGREADRSPEARQDGGEP